MFGFIVAETEKPDPENYFPVRFSKEFKNFATLFIPPAHWVPANAFDALANFRPEHSTEQMRLRFPV